MDPVLERRIRDAYAAFGRGDLDAALEGFRPEATLTNPEYALEGGVRQGRDQLRAGLQALHDEFRYRELVVEDVIEGPEGVLVLARMRASGRASGAPLEASFAHVLQLENDSVVDLAWFRTVEEGRQAIGLDP